MRRAFTAIPANIKLPSRLSKRACPCVINLAVILRVTRSTERLITEKGRTNEVSSLRHYYGEQEWPSEHTLERNYAHAAR